MENVAVLKIKPSMTKMIRKYFKRGHSKVNAAALVILGSILAVIGLVSYLRAGTYLMLFGLLFVGIGVSWLLENDFAGEKETDKAKAALARALKERGMEKLNIVKEQVSLIQPIFLVGPGAVPNESFQKAKAYERLRTGPIKKFVKWIKVKLKKEVKEYDPEEAYMIGSDDDLRSLLLEVSLYCMTEEEILLYVGDVDISTGKIYRELTSECFYQDVEATKFIQSVQKVFHIKEKKYINSMRESFVLYMGGSSFHSSMDSRYRNILLDQKFAAMRNLIRDKKNT